MTTIAESPALLHSPTVASPALTVVDVSDRRSPDLTGSERIGFWMYVAMGSFCVAILIAAAISALAA